MIALPLRPRHRQESGIAAAGRLAHRGTPYGTSLSFATTTHLWPLPDPPSRKSRSATSRTGTARSIPGRALASSVSGSPYQGPGTGLPPPISTSVPGTPATPSRYARRLRDDDRASPEPARLPTWPVSDPTALATTFLRGSYPPPTLTRGGPTNGVRSRSSRAHRLRADVTLRAAPGRVNMTGATESRQGVGRPRRLLRRRHQDAVSTAIRLASTGGGGISISGGNVVTGSFSGRASTVGRIVVNGVD